MRKTLIATTFVAAFALPSVACAQASAAAAPASPHSFTGNVGLFSDYRFRGVSQTFKQPALQGGFDYAHASGLYLGTWASNVYGGTNASAMGVNYFNGSLEWDFYGGYKFELAKDLSLDAGLLYYWYPGAKWGVPTRDKYDNTEIYLGASYKWFSAKYSYALSDYFGANGNTMGTRTYPVTGACGINSAGVATATCAGNTNAGSKGSQYIDLGATFEIGGGYNLVGHIGSLKVKNYRVMNYTDYKLGITKDWSGLTWGAAYIATNAKVDAYRTAKIEGGGNLNVKDTRNGALVLSVTKTF